MINSIFIKNFKIYERETIRIDKNNLIIGENDSGKSTILEALDIFFNNDKIPNTNLVRNNDEDVEIGVLIGNNFYKKKYVGKTKKERNECGNFNDLINIRYVFLKSDFSDPTKLIIDLAIAKSLNNVTDNLIQELQNIMNDSIGQVLDTIDPSFIVVNPEATEFSTESNLKLESALKYTVSSSGIPLDGRGSGYKKNLTYSLLTKGIYDNVILGVDEIENSLSVVNARELLTILNARFGQTLITTHSVKIVEVSRGMNILPRYSNNYNTLGSLMNSLDNTGNSYYLLVEGKFDIPWINKTLQLYETELDFIIIPGGGTDNIDHIKNQLVISGKRVIVVKDGDTSNPDFAINKDVIEMYCPIESLNEILGLSLTEIPNNKAGFFLATTSDVRNEDSVKSILAQKADEFLNETNELINEIIRLIESQI